MRSDSPLPVSNRIESAPAPKPEPVTLEVPASRPAPRRQRAPRPASPKTIQRGLTLECAADVEWLRMVGGLSLRQICRRALVPSSSLDYARAGSGRLRPEYVSRIHKLRAETKPSTIAGGARFGPDTVRTCPCCGAEFTSGRHRKMPGICRLCYVQALQIVGHGTEPNLTAAFARVARIRAARPRTP